MNTKTKAQSVDILYDFLNHLDQYFELNQSDTLRYKIERKHPDSVPDCIIAILFAAHRLSKHKIYQDLIMDYESKYQVSSEKDEYIRAIQSMRSTKKEFSIQLKKLKTYAETIDESDSDCHEDEEEEYHAWLDRNWKKDRIISKRSLK